MASYDYDLFIIGGGSGGVRAARVASGDWGAKVGLAEESRMGGTCVIRGCVPKKLMVFASTYRGAMADAQAYGWEVQAGAFDWSAFRTKLDAELDRLERAYRSGLTSAGVTIYDTRAVVTDAHTVTLASGEVLRAKHILIATGGHPVVPDFAAKHGVLTSNDIFKLDALPKSVLIVGGGYIASEFAGILNNLGVEVTQFYRGAQILRGFDDEARGMIADQMRASGIRLLTDTDVAEMKPAEGGMWVRATSGEVRVFEKVVYATGRAPNTAGLGLAEVGVKLGAKGEVIVDQWSQTSVPSIYAVGDVTDRVNPSLAPANVANVPLGLALMASFTSQVGDYLTRSAELVFGLPDDLNYSKNGMIYGARLMEATRSLRISDPEFAANLDEHFRQCVFYDVLLGQVTVRTVVDAASAAETIARNVDHPFQVWLDTSPKLQEMLKTL